MSQSAQGGEYRPKGDRDGGVELHDCVSVWIKCPRMISVKLLSLQGLLPNCIRALLFEAANHH